MSDNTLIKSLIKSLVKSYLKKKECYKPIT